MKKNVCGLKMLDLYFSEYNFSLTRGEENSDYSSNINISYSSAKDNDLKYKCSGCWNFWGWQSQCSGWYC